MLKEMMNDNKIAIFISIILGLGFASLFRRACNGNECVIIKGPSTHEVQKKVYKVDDKCYKYNPKSTKCPDSSDSK